jgi:hypothetical protein
MELFAEIVVSNAIEKLQVVCEQKVALELRR